MQNSLNTISPASVSVPVDRDILVCVFQRGAADGLNALVPYADPDYYNVRSNIAVPAPGNVGGAIDLNGFFGLHPALSPIKPVYDAGDLALIHATGIPHQSRSHFAAQALVERGVADKSGPDNGWLGRHIALSPPTTGSAFRTVAISGNVPVSLQGSSEPMAFSNVSDFGFDQPVIDLGYPDVLGQLFRSAVPFSTPAHAALSAIEELQAANPGAINPDNGAVYPSSPFGDKLKQAGQLIKSTLPVEVICLDSEGWDHHENLPNFIQSALTDLAGSLSAFYTDMGDQMQRVTVVVHSEFGRRVRENASSGTDHGTAGLAYVMGGGVNGGQVFTDWPGLALQDLEMGEDLKITTDLRTLFAEMLDLRLGGTEVSQVFPGFSYIPPGVFSQR